MANPTRRTGLGSREGAGPEQGSGGGQSGMSHSGNVPVQAEREEGSALEPRGGRSGMWRLDPFSMMDRMSDEMDRLFDSFGFGRMMPGLGRSGLAPGSLARGGGAGQQPRFWSPQIELFEEGNELVVLADLPGMRREDVRIEMQEDTLLVEGERRSERENRGEGVYRSERTYGSFYRAIPLPEGIDADRVKASFRDGVLEVRMPLPDEKSRRGRRIEIEGGEEGRGVGVSEGGASLHSGEGPGGSRQGSGGAGRTGGGGAEGTGNLGRAGSDPTGTGSQGEGGNKGGTGRTEGVP